MSISTVDETTTPASGSTRPIPGLSMLGYGYNIFTGNYCDETCCTELLLDGLDTSADDATPVNVPGYKSTFVCPKIVRLLDEQPINNDYTTFGRTVEEYTSQLTVKAGVSGSYGAFSASVQTSYSQSASSYLEDAYGEHGHVFSGVKLELPRFASQLRAQVKPAIRAALLAKDPQEIIDAYGTHLVTGVVIGAKALLRQYSQTSEVTDTQEWQVALQASYAQVTATASVDNKTSETIKSFKMAQTVQTMGGSNSLVSNSDDFQAWLKTAYTIPAIIDMYAVVPLWQLLDPVADATRRADLKAAIIRYAQQFQIGVLYGTTQVHSSSDGTKPKVDELKTGNSTGRLWQGVFGFFSVSTFYNAESYSWLDLWLGTGQEVVKGADGPVGLAIYGGRQHESSYDSKAPSQQISNWGMAVDSVTNKPLEEQVVFCAFTKSVPQYGDRGMSWISLYVGPVKTVSKAAWVIVGAHQLADDGQRNDYGQPATGDIVEQAIGTAKTWTINDGERVSTLYLHLKPVQHTLPEINESPQQ